MGVSKSTPWCNRFPRGAKYAPFPKESDLIGGVIILLRYRIIYRDKTNTKAGIVENFYFISNTTR